MWYPPKVMLVLRKIIRAMESKEIRILSSNVEVRIEEDKTPVIEGYAAVFNDETVIGGQFAERVAPGAFDGADMANTVALFNHNIDQPLARAGRGLDLEVDEKGLKYRFEVGTQSYAKDLVENIRMGNVSTSSFGFTVKDDSWEKRDGINLRTINEVGLLFDVSPTTQGAYPTTEVALRSMENALSNEDVLKIQEEEEGRAYADPESDEEEDDKEEKSVEGEEEEVEEGEEKKMEEEEEEEEERLDVLVDNAILPHPYGIDANVNPEPEARHFNQSKSNTMENEKNAPAILQSRGDKYENVQSRYSLGKAIREAAQGRLTGLEAEMNQEARSEFTSAKVNVSGGINIPAAFLEARTTATPLSVGADSAVTGSTQTKYLGQIGKLDDGFVGFMQPRDIATQMGVRSISNVSGDIVFQVHTPDPAVAPTVESAPTTVASGQFASATLTPKRIAAHVQVTEQLMAQTSGDLGAFIGSEIRKSCDAKYNATIVAAILSAANTNGLAAYDAASNNALDLEAKMLSDNVEVEDIRCLASPGGYRNARALSLDAGSGLLYATSPADRNSILGYSTVINSSVQGKNVYMMDATKAVSASWGGLNLIVDPYTDADRGVVRIIANMYRGFACLGTKGIIGYSQA
jgi:HK97 family phage prohead protease